MEGRPVNILSRYIISTYLRILGLCLGAFVSIYLVIDFIEKISRFARDQAALQHIGMFFLWKIPEIVNQVLPLAVLMSTLLTLGTLARGSEITAMRGCGISLTRIAAPILTLAFVLSLAALFCGEFVVPRSYERMKYIEDVLISRKSFKTFFRQQNIWYREESVILQSRLFDPVSRTLKGVILWRMGSGMHPLQRIEAEQGMLTDSGWQLKKVVMRDFVGGNVARTIVVPHMPVVLKLKLDDLKVLEKYADKMGFIDLRSYCAKLEKSGYDATRYLAQMQSRVSLPFASLVMAFLGIPFALRGGRTSGIAIGIGISLGIGFSYFITNAVILSFGQAGILTPLVSAWAANFIFAVAGIWLAMTIDH
jgi:lipopolysaccharide export system permease protein